jgi:hypothetical protein
MLTENTRVTDSKFGRQMDARRAKRGVWTPFGLHRSGRGLLSHALLMAIDGFLDEKNNISP